MHLMLQPICVSSFFPLIADHVSQSPRLAFNSHLV